MKKLLVISIISFFAYTSINAQEIAKNALGLRFGDSDGFGTELNYQARLSENNRLEFGLGWRNGKNYDGFKLTGLYQWVWNIEGGFNWYAGVGGGVGTYDFNDRNDNNNDGRDTFAFVAGDIGIEYNLNIPLLISLDFRPELGFGDKRYDNDDLDFDIALSLRYQF